MQLKKLLTVLGTVGIVASLAACSSMNTTKKTFVPVTTSPQYLTDSTPRLGIIAAFGQEADLLLASMTDKKDYLIRGKKFTTGQLENKAVVITLSGISMTNAAMTTQLLSDHFQVKGLVFSGIAGSLNPNYHVGDVVIAKGWMAPNEIYFANTTDLPSACGSTGDVSCLGLALDQSIPPYQQQFFRQTNVINAANYQNVALTTKIGDQNIPVAYGEMKSSFAVDANMWNIANTIHSNIPLEAICSDKNNCYQPKIVMGQRGISSGSFLANAKYRDYLHTTMQGDYVDMETAAVAQVAYANDIPFIAFRSLSDLAGADHDPNVAAFFGSGVAQRNAAKLTIGFVKEWNIR